MNADTDTQVNTETKTEAPWNGWKAMVRPTLSYAIAIGLMLTGPSLLAGALILAYIAGDATIIGIGLLAGAGVGLAGAVALLWCLAGFRKVRSAEAG
jgi:hypothetical protein